MNIDTFSDTEVFFRSMADNPYDLIFLDIGILKNNGIFLSKRIRDDNRRTGRPVVQLSGGKSYCHTTLHLPWDNRIDNLNP